MRPDIEVLRGPLTEEPSSVNDDMEELMAHLFSLRMTVSELTAEVQDVHEAAVRRERPRPSAADAEGEDIAAERAAEHAA